MALVGTLVLTDGSILALADSGDYSANNQYSEGIVNNPSEDEVQIIEEDRDCIRAEEIMDADDIADTALDSIEDVFDVEENDIIEITEVDTESAATSNGDITVDLTEDFESDAEIEMSEEDVAEKEISDIELEDTEKTEDEIETEDFSAEEMRNLGGEILEETILLADNAGQSSNYNAQNYSRWSNPVKSYLVYTKDKYYMRVESVGGELLVAYYDSAFKKVSTKTISMELKKFGGFYASDEYYYVVYGQDNAEEKNSNVVMKVVKYDTSWKKVMEENITGSNTHSPFDAGSLRMTEYDGYLYIRTCHTMYKSDDGYNHQANWTLQIRESDMLLMDSYHDVMNLNYGYVSHSFNQFIMVDDDANLVALDHGDAYPRGFVVGRYGKKAGDSSFSGIYNSKVVLNFEGAVGNNTTGATIGGLEYSTDHYIIAGNTVERGTGWESRKVRNVFISTVNKSDLSSPLRRYITEYEEGGKVSTTTPQLVKLSDDKFLLMWGLLGDEVNGKMSYVFLNGEGKTTSKIYTVDGFVSDCKPIVVNEYVVWYATYNGKLAYYLIKADGSFNASAKIGQEEKPEDNPGGSGDYFEKSLMAATTLTIAKQYYTSREIVPSDASVNLVVGGKKLVQGKDYKIECTNNIEIGTATAVITGIGKYHDSKTLTFKIAERPLGRVKIDTTNYIASFQYDGTAKTQNLSLYIDLKDEDIYLTEGTDYYVEYVNNISAGTAKVKFYGVGKFSGSISKNYKIIKYDMTYSEDITSSLPAEYEYIKGGLKKVLKNDVQIYYKGELLRYNKDYTLLYRNYNPTKSYDGYRVGSLVVKGKGNFTGKKEILFKINCKNLKDVNITAKDKVYTERPGNYIVYPSLKDTNGKSLTRKKDFDSAYEYYAGGKLLSPVDIVPAGTEITVVVKAVQDSMYKGATSYTYRVVANSINKAKITCINDTLIVTYNDIPLVEGVDYEVTHKELNKTGKAYKVELHGLGDYGLTKSKTVTRK